MNTAGALKTPERKVPVLMIMLTSMLLSGGSIASADEPIININPSTYVGGFDEHHGDGMVGWNFQLLEPFVVTQVGWYAKNADGLSRAFQVGLWEEYEGSSKASLIGNPVSGLIIPAGTNGSLLGSWRVVDLAKPLTLQPGSYSIGGLDTSATTDVIKYAGPIGPPPQALAPPGSALVIGEFFYAGASPTTNLGPPSNAYAAFGLELGPMLFGTAAPGSGLNIRRLDSGDVLGRGFVLTWPAGMLQQADVLTGPYTAVTNGVSPYYVPYLSLQKFYRLGP